jgi:drug/metabolite transporter (DMT)-like permease
MHVNPSRLGNGLMACAMLSIPLVDGLAKHLSGSYSPLFLAWARYAIASLIVLPIAVMVRAGSPLPKERRTTHLLRTVCLVIAMTLYFLAIAQIPLATAVSAYFVGPIVAVALSLLVLKERVTPRKLLSLGLGFAGALVILRPGAALEPGILLALGSGIFFAFYLIVTRQAAQVSDPLKTLVFQCVVGALLLTPQAIAFWSAPALGDLLLFAALGALSVLSHLLSIAAFRHAEASTLAPLVYLELIGAALVGYFAFNEPPEAMTLVGAVLIVAAGFLLLERRPQAKAPQLERS